MKFEMNPGWEQAISDMAVDAVSQRFQPILDQLLEDYAGHPVEVVKPALVERWAEGNEGASITDPELTNVASAISEGKRVVMVDGRLATELS